MTLVAYTHIWAIEEIKPTEALLERFPFLTAYGWMATRNPRITTVPKVTMLKRHTAWTRRFLEHFVHETKADVAVKIDPDTEIKDGFVLPAPRAKWDVAGDFRVFQEGWLFMGGYQVYRRAAAEAILADPAFNSGCYWQDAALGKAIHRLGLVAFNMKNVDVWAAPDTDRTALDVYHAGRSDLDRPDHGRVIYE